MVHNTPQLIIDSHPKPPLNEKGYPNSRCNCSENIYREVKCTDWPVKGSSFPISWLVALSGVSGRLVINLFCCLWIVSNTGTVFSSIISSSAISFLLIQKKENRSLLIHKLLVAPYVPGPMPKIGPYRHIEGNLMSNIINESSEPEDYRSLSSFFASKVETGLNWACCSEPPATWQRLPSALQVHSTLSGYESGLVFWNYFI